MQTPLCSCQKHRDLSLIIVRRANNTQDWKPEIKRWYFKCHANWITVPLLQLDQFGQNTVIFFSLISHYIWATPAAGGTVNNPLQPSTEMLLHRSRWNLRRPFWLLLIISFLLLLLLFYSNTYDSGFHVYSLLSSRVQNFWLQPHSPF